MSAQFVADLDRRAIGNHSIDQPLIGEEPEFVRQRSAGDTAQHVFHFVEATRARDVQRCKDFNRPARSEHMQRFDGRFNFPFGIVRALI